MNSIQRSKALLIAAFSLSVGLVATPALALPVGNDAASDYTESSVVVSAKGLDLSQKQDRQRLDRQIRSAANEVCGSKAAFLDRGHLRCYEGAVTPARAQADRMAEQAIQLAASGTATEATTTAAITVTAPVQP